MGANPTGFDVTKWSGELTRRTEQLCRTSAWVGRHPLGGGGGLRPPFICLLTQLRETQVHDDLHGFRVQSPKLD